MEKTLFTFIVSFKSYTITKTIFGGTELSFLYRFLYWCLKYSGASNVKVYVHGADLLLFDFNSVLDFYDYVDRVFDSPYEELQKQRRKMLLDFWADKERFFLSECEINGSLYRDIVDPLLVL